MAALTIPAFGGGVILAGSSDAQSTNEMEQCDGWDIGPRGQLQSAPTTGTYITINDQRGTPQPLSPIYALATVRYGSNTPLLIAVGLGKDSGNANRYFFGEVSIDAGLAGTPSVNQVVVVSTGVAPASPFTPPTTTVAPTTFVRHPVVTFALFPYVNGAGVQMRPLFINIGARYFDSAPRDMAGLYALTWNGAAYIYGKIGLYDALGTGPSGEFAGGTNAKQLFFRGVVAYNNHLFGWGFDNNDSSTGEGSSRLMFSNLGNPFKWGNDNVAGAGVDRAFTDTDAITVGSAGESITAAIASRGKLWIGTNRGLHYLSGYGRDSFITDGTTGIAESLDVVGPYGLIEGPDGMPYGLSARGLWVYGGNGVVHLYRSLVEFDGSSNGYWDLLAGGNTALGTGNLDLAWLRSDPIRNQVWVVIPGCNATTGTGLGSDTVIIKYHTETGGFTRQVITGQTWLTGTDIHKGTNQTEHVFIPPAGSTPNVLDYGPGAANPGPITFGEYAPFGTQGTGVNRVHYLTLSWASGALPITGTLTPSVDQRAVAPVALTIGVTAPVSPTNGDVWVDTSETDTNLGNGTSSSMISASNVYLVKVWVTTWAVWRIVSRSSGVQGTRITIPVAYDATRGTRVKFTWDLNSGGDLQIEGIGMSPSTVRSAA